ncbi:MAG: hypothetical protein CMJ48_00470 [Planctomycetaceae bacterium]|nr:hypothetical protein [Planctomycetaceae bacterium]
MKFLRIAFPGLVVLAVVSLVTWAARAPLNERSGAPKPDSLDFSATDELNQALQAAWDKEGLQAPEPADDLQVLRRLSLALHGTLPSLEELREFEADAEPDKLARWTQRMLADVRFGDYFAERLTRIYIGTDNGAFVIFRRGRFVEWLSEQLHNNERYDEIVRTMISAEGLWTDAPEVNFITGAMIQDEDEKNYVDVNKLTGRVARAFLGQRIDCAECHDSKFDDWLQSEFQGLAAFFGQSEVSIAGVEEKSETTYEVEDRDTLEKRVVEPQVPFHPEWLPKTGTRRERLAGWVTHAENRRFERAIANRVWGLMFGRAWFPKVDDLPDPSEDGSRDVLDILGADFREHNYDLRRLIGQIAASKAFRASSHTSSDDAELTERLEKNWALFPLTRLRPEQVIGSMLQASSIRTIDQNSHLLVRTIRLLRENDFISEYGDLGENELDEHAGTIPQALLRMNGKFATEMTEVNLLNASGRIESMSSTSEKCVESCFLVCLTRRPTKAEYAHFTKQFEGATKEERQAVVEDLFWSLYNSPEFSWDH